MIFIERAANKGALLSARAMDAAAIEAQEHENDSDNEILKEDENDDCDESCDCAICTQKRMFSELNEKMRDAHEGGRMDLGVFVEASAKLQEIYNANEEILSNVYNSFSFELAFGAPRCFGLFINTRVGDVLKDLKFCSVVLKKRREVEEENKDRDGDYTAGVATGWLRDFLWLFLKYFKQLVPPVWVMVLVGYESDEKKIWELISAHVADLDLKAEDICCLGKPEETLMLATICRHSKSARAWLSPSLFRGVKRDIEEVITVASTSRESQRLRTAR